MNAATHLVFFFSLIPFLLHHGNARVLPERSAMGIADDSDPSSSIYRLSKHADVSSSPMIGWIWGSNGPRDKVIGNALSNDESSINTHPSLKDGEDFLRGLNSVANENNFNNKKLGEEDVDHHDSFQNEGHDIARETMAFLSKRENEPDLDGIGVKIRGRVARDTGRGMSRKNTGNRNKGSGRLDSRREKKRPFDVPDEEAAKRPTHGHDMRGASSENMDQGRMSKSKKRVNNQEHGSKRYDQETALWTGGNALREKSVSVGPSPPRIPVGFPPRDQYNENISRQLGLLPLLLLTSFEKFLTKQPVNMIPNGLVNSVLPNGDWSSEGRNEGPSGNTDFNLEALISLLSSVIPLFRAVPIDQLIGDSALNRFGDSPPVPDDLFDSTISGSGQEEETPTSMFGNDGQRNEMERGSPASQIDTAPSESKWDIISGQFPGTPYEILRETVGMTDPVLPGVGRESMGDMAKTAEIAKLTSFTSKFLSRMAKVGMDD